VPDRSQIVLAAVVGLTSFLVATAVWTGREQRQAEAPRRAELVELIDARRELVTDLDVAVKELRADVLQARERASGLTAREREIAETTERLAVQAGTVALRGPGLVVTMSSSDREPSSVAEAGAYRVHDSDLQLVVNALLAAGAEAVAVNDSRIVSTTAIRAAGDTIVVNFRPLLPPYRVKAIGANPRTFEASDIARRFKRWTELFGLGFSVRTDDEIEVPPYTGRVSISTAQPAE
jgi:uncharacterized protein YlxW (UPF0749 family)